MRKNFLLICIAAACLAPSCSKQSNKAFTNSPVLVGTTWQLIASLADPGDGSGTWRNYTGSPRYLRLNADSTVYSNDVYMQTHPYRYSLRDGAIYFINTSTGDTYRHSYQLSSNILTLTGPCIEPCGERYKAVTE